LDCLDDDHAVLALLRIYAVIFHLENCVLDAVDFEAFGEDVAGVGVGVYDDLHLVWFDREVRRVGPVVFAVDAEDGGAVDIAAADEAGVNVRLPGHGCKKLGSNRAVCE